jgi:surface polysaccharide O-acyltransferase-like enzyme
LVWVYLIGWKNGEPPTIQNLGGRLLSGKPYVHLWFLYMLPGLYFFTPLLRKITVRFPPREAALFLPVMFLCATVHAAVDPFAPAGETGPFINWFLQFIPYFLTGHIIRQAKSTPPVGFLAAVWGCSLAATVGGGYYLAMDAGSAGNYFSDFLSINVTLMSISAMWMIKRFWESARGGGAPGFIAPLMLGVYLIHPMIIATVDHFHLGAMSYSPWISIPITSAAVFAVALAAAWILSRLPILQRTI